MAQKNAESATNRSKLADVSVGRQPNQGAPQQYSAL
jgi:hypothetical protein